MQDHDRPTLTEAQESLRLAKFIRDSARDRGSESVAEVEEGIIEKLEDRIEALEEESADVVQTARPQRS